MTRSANGLGRITSTNTSTQWPYLAGRREFSTSSENGHSMRKFSYSCWMFFCLIRGIGAIARTFAIGVFGHASGVGAMRRERRLRPSGSRSS